MEKESNFKVEIKGSKVIIEAEFPTETHLGDCLSHIRHYLYHVCTDRDGKPYLNIGRDEIRKSLSTKPILDFAECIDKACEEAFRH